MQPAPTAFPTPPDTPVLFVTHEFAPFRGGVAVYVQEAAAAARAAGFAVEVWAVDYRGRLDPAARAEMEQADAALPFPLARLPSSGRLTPAGLLGLVWGLWRRRRELRERPVVLLSVGAQIAFFLLHALGAAPARRVTCFLHGSEPLRFARSRFWRELARRCYAQAAGFAVPSGAMARLARDSGLLPPNAKILVAPGALPPGLLRNNSSEMFHTEQSGDGDARVLTVARLHPRKGQLEVALALALLPEAQRAGVVYQMVGVGEESYRRRIAEACRTGGVRCEFLGAVPDAELGAVYRRATVYAQASVTLPNSVEGFGISFLEAAFHGCPVAAYRSGGVESAVADGETGLLVPEGDRGELAKAISQLLGDAALRARLGAAGRDWARGFSWEASARALCEMVGVQRTGDTRNLHC